MEADFGCGRVFMMFDSISFIYIKVVKVFIEGKVAYFMGFLLLVGEFFNYYCFELKVQFLQ